MSNKWAVIVPARLQSSRLPEKPLQLIGNKPLIVHVFENLNNQWEHISRDRDVELIFAIDDEKVQKVCNSYGIPYQMTSSDHRSGTDRVFEVCQDRNYDFVLNVQGDEPFIRSDDVNNVMIAMESDPKVDWTTIVFKSDSYADYSDRNCVKCVFDCKHFALYFSRAPIPFIEEKDFAFFYQHIGMYAYRVAKLNQFCQLPQSPLEQIERLEQLRALDANFNIKIVKSEHKSIGIDTPSDLAKAREMLQ